MGWSFSLGRLFGSEIRVHITFFLLLAWVGYAAYSQLGPEAALWNVLFIMALFGCVVAHEFGHALMARRYGIKTPDITLLPIGGLARLERMPENPVHEILVALAGPAVNIVIWLILAVGFGIKIDIEALADPQMTAREFLSQLALVNLVLAVFNMIPAFPMDGGRVFRAVLSLWMDRVKATRIAGQAGQIVAILLAFAGLSGGNPMLVLVALFVFMAAAAESKDVAMRSVARQLVARDALITSFDSLTPDDSIDTAAAALIRTTQHEFPILDMAGTLLGFVTRDALFQAKITETPGMQPVSTIMTTDIPQIRLATGLETVLDTLHKGHPAVAVTSPEGRMIGYITRENIGELMVIKGR
ncbi:site-2 protease family protein [Arenibacterium sp. CAU 1754]